MKELNFSKKSFCSFSCLCKSWPYFLLGVSGLTLVLLGILKFMAMEWIVDQQISKRLRLIPNSDAYTKWKQVPLPIIIKFRIFNVTNPVAVQNGAKPKLVEAGPYVFEERRVKEIISSDSERDTISYRQRIYFTFRGDLSNGSEQDRLVVINVPFVTLSKLTYDNVGNFSFAHALADRNMRQRGERLFTFATVKEYLFDGYSVQHYLNFLKSPALTLIGGVKIPKSIETGRFGFYLGKNGSDDGEYVIRTGKSNPQEFGQIVSWNGKTKLDYYHGGCNLINGTDGSLVPPFVTKESKLRFFSSDICRSIFTVFREESKVKGIKTYRFRPPNAKKIAEHKDFCFCPTGKNNECFKHGVLSMAPCRDGAPIAMSSVHFLDAYEPYLNGVEGLRPEVDKHETFIDIEPKTGLILRAAKRVQFNVKVTPNRDMYTFAQVRPTLFPFMWVEEIVEPTDAYISELNEQLFQPQQMASVGTTGGMIFSGVLFLVALFSLFCRKSSDIKSVSRESSRSRSGSISSVKTTVTGKSIDSYISRGTMTEEKNATN